MLLFFSVKLPPYVPVELPPVTRKGTTRSSVYDPLEQASHAWNEPLVSWTKKYMLVIDKLFALQVYYCCHMTIKTT